MALQTGAVAALEFMRGHPRPAPADGAALGGLPDLLDRWPGTVAACIPAGLCAPALPDALHALVQAQRARLFGARPLEVLLPAAFAGAGLDTLLTLSELMDEGVTPLLDCTAAGLPAIPVLERFPLAGIVLDAGIVLPDRADKAAALRLRATLRACADLGIAVLASGIETEAQRAVFCALGCTQGSGDLFAPALAQEASRQLALH